VSGRGEHVNGEVQDRLAPSSLSIVWVVGVWALSLAPSCVSLVWYGHSPDRRHRLRVIEKHGSQQVQWDGRAGRRHHSIGIGAIAFSPDSRRLAYPAQCRCGHHWFVVLDGRQGRCWNGIGEIRFSPNSRHLAYAALRNKKWHVVRDGRVGPAVDAIFKRTLRWNPDSRHLAYVAQIGRAKRVVVDGKVGPPFGRIASLTFGARGRVAYVAQRRSAWFVVMNHRQSRPYQSIAGLIFSRDGSHFAYAAQVGSKAHVVLDGRDQPLYDAIRFQTLRFTTGGRLIYVARQASRYRVVFGDRPGPLYDAIEPPSVGGHRWGYVARTGKKHVVVINGKVRHGPLRARRVGDLVFSSDGRRYAYVVHHGGSGSAGASVLHKGRTSTFEMIVGGTLVLGRDGRHWACLAGSRSKKKLFISVDGRRQRPFDSAELTAEVMRRGSAPPDLLRRWVAAELELAVSRRKPGSLRRRSGRKGRGDRSR
jgi:hypothetical protein